MVAAMGGTRRLTTGLGEGSAGHCVAKTVATHPNAYQALLGGLLQTVARLIG